MVVLDYQAPEPRAPGALVAAAWIFIAFGILAAVEMALSLVLGKMSINFGVLGIFIGRGLLRRSQVWRTWAMVVLWISMAIVCLSAIAVVYGGASVMVNRGALSRGLSLLVAAVACTGLFVLFYWQYKVLVRADVLAWFSPRSSPLEVRDAAERLEQVEDDRTADRPSDQGPNPPVQSH